MGHQELESDKHSKERGEQKGSDTRGEGKHGPEGTLGLVHKKETPNVNNVHTNVNNMKHNSVNNAPKNVNSIKKKHVNDVHRNENMKKNSVNNARKDGQNSKNKKK